MEFQLESSRCLLARTPETLRAWLSDLPESWIHQNEGPDTWSPFDIVGHLVQGERSDWIPRARIILQHASSQAFEPFDRFAQLEASRGKPFSELLECFATLRAQNLEALDELQLSPQDLLREGRHPELGVVTLGQLLATWVVHDLGHIAQAARVMAKGYSSEVGPWSAYLPILGG